MVVGSSKKKFPHRYTIGGNGKIFMTKTATERAAVHSKVWEFFMWNKASLRLSGCFLLFMLVVCIWPAHASDSLLQKDFDGDGHLDSMAVATTEDNSLIVKYTSSISQNKIIYTFSAFDQCSQMGFYRQKQEVK